MKHLILVTALLAMTFTFGQDKGKGEKREVIEQEKIAFITKEVGFTEKEAEQFWPKYNEMETATSEHRKKLKEAKKELKDIDSKSDKDIKRILDNLISLEKEAVQLKENFKNTLFEFLPAKKVGKYFIAEHQFKKMLIEKLKEQKGAQGGSK